MDEASEPRRTDPASSPVDVSNGSTYAAALGALRIARRIAVGVIGSTVVAVGVAMLVLPGPGLVVIPAGLGILGLEFAFARRWLVRLRERAADVAAKVSASVTSAADAGEDDDAKDAKDEEDLER